MRPEAGKKLRIAYFDTAKGVLILLVILGHVLAYEESYIKAVIYTFHVPAFFIISGMLAAEGSSLRKPFAAYGVQKVRSLLIPYVVFEAICQLVENAKGGFWMNIKGYTFTVISNCLKNSCANYANWFLIALFFGELLLYFFQRIRWKLPRVILLVCTVILPVIVQNGIIRQTLYAFVFLAIGVLVGEMKEKKSVPIYLAIFSGVLVLLVAGINGRISIGDGKVNNPLLFYVGGLAGTFFILWLSKKWLQKCTFLNYCGKNSLYIMGLHVPAIRLCGFIYDYFDNTIVEALVVFVVVTSVVMIIVLLINRTKAALLFRKNQAD